MQDLIKHALFAMNLPLTILVAGLGVYWLAAAFGILSLEGGGEGDALDAADVEIDGEIGAWGSLLHFLNVGEVPLMIVVTVLTLSMWVIGMLSNAFLNNGSILLGLVYLVPNFAVSVVITRYATMPFKKVLRLLNSEGEEHEPLVGRTCFVTTSQVTADFGQAEVATKGAPVLLQVRVRDGSTLFRGDNALIIGEDKAKGTYTVIKVSNDKLEV